jgi:hypothetical protein
MCNKESRGGNGRRKHLWVQCIKKKKKTLAWTRIIYQQRTIEWHNFRKFGIKLIN